MFPRFNDINAPKARFDFLGGKSSNERHVSIETSIHNFKLITPRRCHHLLRYAWMSCQIGHFFFPYSVHIVIDETQFVGSKRIDSHSLTATRRETYPGCGNKKHGNRISTYMIWIFLHYNWVPLLTRSFPIPTSSSFVMDVSFCRIWSLKAFTSLLANHRAPSPTPVKVNMSPEKGPCEKELHLPTICL